MPASMPVVFQVKVALLEYGCTKAQVPPGGSSQNWYCGFGQPLAAPVMVTTVPNPAVEGGDDEALIAVQGVVVSV